MIKRLRSYISSNPLMSVGIAVGLGFLLNGLLLELVSAAMLMMVDNGIAASSAMLFAVAFNLLLTFILWNLIRSKRYLTWG